MKTRLAILFITELFTAFIAVKVTGDPRIAIPIVIGPVGFSLIVSAFREALEEYK